MATYSPTTNGDYVIRLMPDDRKGGVTKDDANLDDGDDEKREEGRFTWTRKREYILAAIGYCVGLGNVWRFPYLCQRNGGGAFLIPFLLSLVVCGLPLYFMEAAIGQFAGRSTVHIWSICPLLQGAGIGMNLVSLLCFWYYNTIMAWTFYYLVSSCQTVVPWSRCDGWWNTELCTDLTDKKNDWPMSVNSSLVAADGFSNRSVLYNAISTNSTDGLPAFLSNVTSFHNNATDLHTSSVSAAEEFWQHNVLQVSKGFEEPGQVVWYLVVTLCATLLLQFFALVKGVKSTGKVVYVTALLPYVLILAMLIRGATLPGAVDGIIFYLKPDFSRLRDPEVWVQAALQVFYSLGPAWGGIVTLGSYNKFNNNCLRDSILLTFVCEGTSIYGGFAIFAVLGYMAHQSGVPVEKVVSSGPGLAFIVYPEAISLMPLPQLWAVLFFIMIVMLAVDSQLTVAETVLTTLCDIFPRSLHRHRILITAVFCVLFLPLGLPIITQGGVYVFQLVDWYIATFLPVLCFLECVAIGWIYGADYFSEDIQMMIGRKPPMVFRILWCFITPFCLLLLTVCTLLSYTSPTYGDYQYSTGGVIFGWLIASVSILPIPFVAVYKLYSAKGTLLQRLQQTTRPDRGWGPGDVKQRTIYRKEVLNRKPRSGFCDIVRR